MCVGVPLQVIAADDHAARCIGPNGEEVISLALIGAVSPGDHVLAHLGSAIRVVDADEAKQIRDALGALEAAMAGQPFDHLIADLIEREPQLPPHLQSQTNTKNSPASLAQNIPVEDTHEPSSDRHAQSP